MKFPRIFLVLINSFLWQPSFISFWKSIRNYLPLNIRDFIGHSTLFILNLDTIGNVQQIKDMTEKQITTLAIENTNICNANCQFCAYRYQKRPKDFMSNNSFKQSIKQFAEIGGGALLITPVVGDPLIDKDLINKIRFGKKIKEIKYIFLFTNLIGLNEFNITDFILSGLDEINISVCIGSREMYKRIFGVDKYSTVINNLENLLIENRKLGNKVKVHIHLRAEKPYSSTTSSSDYQYLSKKYGRDLFHIDSEYDNWTGIITKNSLPKDNPFKKIKNMSEPCQELYNGVIVFANGDVGGCWRRDIEGKLVIGNIYDNSLNDIWKGKNIRIIRQNWIDGKIPDVCKNCFAYEPLSVLLANARAQNIRYVTFTK
ncbi:MAG: radical SAM protein [Candidatus Bathyarchaeia archaeon]